MLRGETGTVNTGIHGLCQWTEIVLRLGMAPHKSAVGMLHTKGFWAADRATGG